MMLSAYCVLVIELRLLIHDVRYRPKADKKEVLLADTSRHEETS